mgnify:CR=1 FL=1
MIKCYLCPQNNRQDETSFTLYPFYCRAATGNCGADWWYDVCLRQYQERGRTRTERMFRLAFIETVDNEINNLPFPDMTIPFYSYLSKDSIWSFEDEIFLDYQQAAPFSKMYIVSPFR